MMIKKIRLALCSSYVLLALSLAAYFAFKASSPETFPEETKHMVNQVWMLSLTCIAFGCVGVWAMYKVVQEKSEH